jgi:hypothetical protein
MALESLLHLFRFSLLTGLDLAYHLLNQVNLLVLLKDCGHPLNDIVRSPLNTAGPTLLLGRVFDALVRFIRMGGGGLGGQSHGPLSLISVVQNLPLMLLDFFLDLGDLLVNYGERVLLDSL